MDGSEYASITIMLAFFSLPAPYLDFALINFGSQADRWALENKMNALKAHDMGVRRVSQKEGGTMLVTPDPGRIGSTPNGMHGMSGLAKIDDSIYIPWGPPDAIALSKIDSEAGQYTCFEAGAGTVDVWNDFFGYGQIFASQHSGITIISNRLHLHKIVMVAAGEKVAPEPAAVMGALFSEHQFFGQQSAISKTMIRGVQKVPVSKTVRAQHGTLQTIDKPGFQDAAAPHGDYAQRIESGVEKIIDSTAAALSDPQFEQPILELTGGKDSRMVFGAALHRPSWKERAVLGVLDLPKTEDMPIASGISYMYGGAFYDGSAVEEYPMTLEENSNLWRSYFFGQYHRVGAGAWSHKGTNTAEINISGFNGEIYRTYWSNIVRNHLSAASNTTEFASSLVDGASNGLYDRESLDPIIEALTAELDSFPSETVSGKVEDHYLFHRNRTHCGLRGFSSYHERMTWTPLQSADLMAANRLLPAEQRETSKVIHDVLDKLDPLLNRLRFDGGYPFNRNDEPETLRLYEDAGRWHESAEKRKRNTLNARAGKAGLMRWADWPAHMRDLTLDALVDLEASPALSPLMPTGLRARYLSTHESNRGLAMQMSSQILSVADSCL